MARRDLSSQRNSYLELLESKDESLDVPRYYYCPHHKADYYMRHPTLEDEERYNDSKRYKSDARRIAARVAILLVDENGKQLLDESDVPRLMKMKGFLTHAIDMLVELGDTDPDEFNEEEMNEEKKESSTDQYIGSS